MITLSFPWLVALVVPLFLAALALMACLKSPMRKWVCFGLSFVSLAYLLYIMLWQQQDSDQKLDWFLFGCVIISAALALAGIGYMDMMKPKPLIVPVPNIENPPVLLAEEDEQIDDVNGELNTDDSNKESEAEKIQREELIEKVLPWFLDQLNQYGEDEQNAIKVCAIEFVNDSCISVPTVKIAKNTLYSQQRIMELCSCFLLLNKERSDCAEFAKTVFADTFNNTEISTLEKKIKGKDRMQILIDVYREAVNH